MACTAFRHLRMAGNIDYPSHDNNQNAMFPLSLRARAPDVVTSVSLGTVNHNHGAVSTPDRDAYELDSKFPNIEINIHREVETNSRV